LQNFRHSEPFVEFKKIPQTFPQSELCGKLKTSIFIAVAVDIFRW